MQLSAAPSKIVLAFAADGSKNTIPVASQIGVTPGAASYTDGFPPVTREPIAAGGIPPYGVDMNGILFAATALSLWQSAGANFIWDSTFASTLSPAGYPKGATVLHSDGTGFWFNVTDNNTVDPEGSGAVAAGWLPGFTTGKASVTMTNANVTLTQLQYGKPLIVITGLLTTNLQLIFPDNVPLSWVIVNETTGAFTITCKTVSGSGVTVSGSQGIVSDGTNISATGASTGPSRILLTGSANYYVATTGNDSTGDGSSGNPWLTIEHAINYIIENIDTAGNSVTINVANGSYAAGGTLPGPLVGSGLLLIVGDTGSPSSCSIAVTSLSDAFPFTALQCGIMSVDGFEISNSVGYGAGAVNGGRLFVGPHMIYGACLTNQLIAQDAGSYLNITPGYAISGSAGQHIGSNTGAQIINSGTGTVTLTGTPAYSSAFVSCDINSISVLTGITWSGSATGVRFIVDHGGVIITGTGGNLTYFPGNSAGSLNNGAYDQIIGGVVGNAEQAYSNVTGSRAFGTTYTNSTSAPIFVTVQATSTSSAPLLNGVVAGVTLAGTGGVATNEVSSISFIVPDGDVYSVVGTNNTLDAWVELR